MRRIPLFFIVITILLTGNAFAEPPVSEATEECISCHGAIHPGIVGDWKKSRHSQWTPQNAMQKGEVERRISAAQVPEDLSNVAVGCAECHTANSEDHKDSFEHNGFQVHIVVSPKDCETCHPTEVEQYGMNLMSHAHGNLKNNPVYSDLAKNINGERTFDGMKTAIRDPDEETEADSCFFCHGTVVKVEGMQPRETDLGEMTFPVLNGWPNQGVGRINPDGSKGACTPCHARHSFSIQMARKPHTCSQCHKGPDVPAYPVYQVSKHGNMYSTWHADWDFDAVPWKTGKDFTGPTCATCHISLLTSEDGDITAERTHRMNDRLPWRLFGLIYAHAHPKSPDTTIIRNASGLPLPTDFSGEPASEFLIDEEEQWERLDAMKKVCASCHGFSWVDGHFKRLENTIRKSNAMTAASTKIQQKAWDTGVSKGLEQKDSLFNDGMERKWAEQWLFYANSIRFASAMAGADYGVFEKGRWNMSKGFQELFETLKDK